MDELLGDKLPEAIVDAFVASLISRFTGPCSNPLDHGRSHAQSFYTMVDDQLGNMSTESIEAFVASSNYEIYREIGEQYKDA